MFLLFVFTCGYLVGGLSALLLIGLTVASQRGDTTQHMPMKAVSLRKRR